MRHGGVTREDFARNHLQGRLGDVARAGSPRNLFPWKTMSFLELMTFLTIRSRPARALSGVAPNTRCRFERCTFVAKTPRRFESAKRIELRPCVPLIRAKMHVETARCHRVHFSRTAVERTTIELRRACYFQLRLFIITGLARIRLCEPPGALFTFGFYLMYSLICIRRFCMVEIQLPLRRR